jgi:hypothetical protein
MKHSKITLLKSVIIELKVKSLHPIIHSSKDLNKSTDCRETGFKFLHLLMHYPVFAPFFSSGENLWKFLGRIEKRKIET